MGVFKTASWAWVFFRLSLVLLALVPSHADAKNRFCLRTILLLGGLATTSVVQDHGPALKEVPISISKKTLRKSVSLEEARDLHEQIAAIEELDFSGGDGCHGRAHTIAQWLEEKGIDSRKLFLFARSTKPSRGFGWHPPIFGRRWKNWKEHMANVVSVSQNGHDEDYVLDPAVSHRPLKLESEYLPKALESRNYNRTSGIQYYSDEGVGFNAKFIHPGQDYWINIGPRYALFATRHKSSRGSGWMKSEMETASQMNETNFHAW